MSIKVNRFTFHCTFTTEARLPEYLGSALRGALGWSLKKTSCALRTRQCQSCILREQCAYAWIFETERYRDSNGRSVNARPHPFVLQPGEGTSGFRKAGDQFDFSLLLIDRAIDYLPHIIFTLQRMGEGGIGAGNRSGMGRFRLDRVSAGNEEIYNADEEVLHKPEECEQLALETGAKTTTREIEVQLLTPLRVKLGNELHDELPFHVLVRSGLRRIAALEEAYGGGEPNLDYRGIISRAELVETVKSSIKWREMLRFSNRQRQKVSLSGLTGAISYRGELDEFMPLLTYCENVHLGKQTVFGLGRISVTHRGKEGK
ncbi:MAG: CRISPR system precrRNA processing endoribonuclease RAMP protein Cas6 [Desulfobulbaceae bacterium]|nr:CRISPR system precrRNA processing endoribonuclease RAMP protein Cas6 [Desulfobulbaceae bacterium]